MCLYVYHLLHTWCLKGSEEDIRSFVGLELEVVVSHHIGARNGSGPLEEQQMCLISEPSLQSSVPPPIFALCLYFLKQGFTMYLCLVAWSSEPPIASAFWVLLDKGVCHHNLVPDSIIFKLCVYMSVEWGYTRVLLESGGIRYLDLNCRQFFLWFCLLLIFKTGFPCVALLVQELTL